MWLVSRQNSETEYELDTQKTDRSTKHAIEPKAIILHLNEGIHELSGGMTCNFKLAPILILGTNARPSEPQIVPTPLL